MSQPYDRIALVDAIEGVIGYQPRVISDIANAVAAALHLVGDETPLAFINATLIDLGHPEAIESRLGAWWTVVRQEELAGRSIVCAYLDGDEDEVRNFIRSQYYATEASFQSDLPELRTLLASRRSGQPGGSEQVPSGDAGAHGVTQDESGNPATNGSAQ